MGTWTLEKLTLLREYLDAYVIATRRARARGNVSYVDLFAGPGKNRSRDTGEVFDGSPLIAMRLYPGFSRFVFVESDPASWESLQVCISEVGRSADADVVFGDCNQKINEVVDKVPKDGPCFVFLDPSSPSLDWNTVASVASMRVGYRKLRPEQFILFPYSMGIARMLPSDEDPVEIWGNVTEEQISRVMPDSKWLAVYRDRRQGEYGAAEQRRRFLYLYWMGLVELGYKHVLKPRPIRTPEGLLLYYMFFASDSDAGERIMSHVLNKRRTMFEQLPLLLGDPLDFQNGELWYLELQGGNSNAR